MALPFFLISNRAVKLDGLPIGFLIGAVFLLLYEIRCPQNFNVRISLKDKHRACVVEIIIKSFL